MRIVADTNTVLSGLLWQGGPPRQIIDRARAGTITLHTSLVLLAELVEDYQRLAVLGAFNHMPILPARQVLDFITASTTEAPRNPA
ncbi:MAG: PIN domain-containing protein [Gammaproteobacteria bacterium]|nr:PIN domain-containing protein [Gammaproteobacteria bacterium]